MEKLNYLNVGCGSKYHKLWVNVDMSSNSKDVISANLLKGIPFSDNEFDVVYHSQVLEHIPKEKAENFIKECYRVLKPNGIIRVVVPDLENIVDEYKKYLNKNLEEPTDLSIANYDWIMIEMFDQMVRNQSGGQFSEYFNRPEIINEKYVFERMGFSAKKIRNEYLSKDSKFIRNFKMAFSSFNMFKKAIKYGTNRIFQKTLQSKASQIGNFRLGGEIHMWMYDRYSLSKLLLDCGFTDVSIKNPFESDIPNWKKYELDVKDDLVYDPKSLFMEARK